MSCISVQDNARYFTDQYQMQEYFRSCADEILHCSDG